VCPTGALSHSPGLRRQRRGYPGDTLPHAVNPTGVAADRDAVYGRPDATPLGLFASGRRDTQGSGADTATLGYGTESRWDSAVVIGM
jgi:hypothetical protein